MSYRGKRKPGQSGQEKKLTWEQMKRVQCFKGEAQDGPTENGIDRTEIRLHRLPEREQTSDLMPHYI